MNIEQALERQDMPDKIYIGEVAEKFYNSEAGELLRALLTGLRSNQSTMHRAQQSISADRVLGRIEAYQEIQDAFEGMIADKNKLVTPQEIPDKEDKGVARPEELDVSPLEV